MFAVVVLLIKPREHIIVPEGYILGLTDLEDDLKTWGANKTHDHLIFWSNNLLDENIVPDEAIAPDFTFARCEVFPPPAPSDAGCYIGRIKRFFKSFEAARKYRDQFRAVLPVSYNPNSTVNQPAPPNRINNEIDQNDSQNNEISGIETDNQNTDVEEKLVLAPVNLDEGDNIALDSLLVLEGFVDVDDEETSTGSADNSIHQDNENDEENASESATIDNQLAQMKTNNSFNQNSERTTSREQNNEELSVSEPNQNVSQEESNSFLCSYKPNNGEKVTVCENGQIKITQFIDEEVEMTYIHGQKLQAMKDRFQVKMNDPLSGNLPFQENKQEDRAYPLKVNGVYNEVKLSGRVVKWLIGLNTEHRVNCRVDKSFIKALLIAVFSVKLIKSGDPLEEDLMAFIEGLFSQRIGDDALRLHSFENLVSVASNEIRKL